MPTRKYGGAKTAKLPLKSVKTITKNNKTTRRNASTAVSKKRDVKRALLYAARQIPEHSVPSDMDSQSDTPTIVAATIGSPQQNDGEKGESEVVNYLNSIDPTKAVEIFGQDATGGIEASGVGGGDKAASKDKADIKITMKTGGFDFLASVKRSDCKGNPSVMNMTRRDEVVFQPGGILHNQVDNLDTLIKAFNYTGRKLALSTSNKNTRDAAHAGQKNSLEEVYLRDILNDIDGAIAGQLQSNALLPSHPVQLGDIATKNAVLNAFVELMAYFLFQGTGRGDSTNPANSMIVWNGATQEVLFSDCRTPQQKRDYVEKNIKNFKICMQKTSVGSGQQWAEVLGYSKKEGKVVVKSGLAVRIDLGKNCEMKSRKPAKKSRGITKKTKTKESKTKKTKN